MSVAHSSGSVENRLDSTPDSLGRVVLPPLRTQNISDYSKKETGRNWLNSPGGIVSICGLLAIFVTVLQFANWRGTRELHTIMEVVATLFAFIVGVLSLVRYYSKKENAYLFLGVGFLGTAFLDGYHAIVTSGLLNYLMPSPPESLIPWSWTASRSYLAVLMVATLFASGRTVNRIDDNRKTELLTLSMLGGLTIASFCFFAFVPLSKAHYPEFVFSRPGEFIAAVLFFIALCGYAARGNTKINSFDSWIVWSLIVGFVAQAAAMSRSQSLFDTAFD